MSELKERFENEESYFSFLGQVEKCIDLYIDYDEEDAYYEDMIEIEIGKKSYEVEFTANMTAPYVHANYRNYPPDPPQPSEWETNITTVRCYDEDGELEYEHKETIEL